MILLEVETTGLCDPKPIQVAYFDRNTGTGCATYCNPGKWVSQEATRLHGRTEESLRLEPSAESVVQTVPDGFWIAWNLKFACRALGRVPKLGGMCLASACEQRGAPRDLIQALQYYRCPVWELLSRHRYDARYDLFAVKWLTEHLEQLYG